MQTLPLMRPAATFVFFIALIADAQCVSAAPVFQVHGEGGQGSFDLSSSSFLSHGSVGVFSTTDPVNGHTSAQADNAFAAAGPGELRLDANSRAFRNFVSDLSGGSADRITASADASMTLDDVIISGPVGMITTSYNIHLNGTLEAFADLQAPSSGATAIVDLILLANGHLLNEFTAIKDNGRPQVGSDLTGSHDLTSDAFTVTANQAFTVNVRLSVLAQSTLNGRDSGSVNAAAHFSDTLTFVTDGPVFELPAGYTASSISGNIADNHFVLAPVPLPAAIWLFGSAFGGLGLMRRRART